ncbi:MAG: SAM-dependent methyltransferase [Verrucomicrobiia bacterium]
MGRPAQHAAELLTDRNMAARVLGDLLREKDGEISWEEFVQTALYHPEVGYYARRICDVGIDGDFATSASLGTSLGRAISAYARRFERNTIGPLRLVEIGAGNGRLMSEVLRGLPLFSRLRWRPAIIETSLPLIKRQKCALRFRGVRWFRSPFELPVGREREILGFANELIDAFPPLVVVMRNGTWREVALRVERGKLVEIEREPSPRCGEAIQQANSLPAKDGVRREILYSFRDWMTDVARCQWRGRLLLVDYGSAAEDLYRRAPQGTLRAYYKHQRLTGRAVLERFGRQDITCDVNFTDIGLWARELGWSVLKEQTQAEFLEQHGVKLMNNVDRRLGHSNAAGGAFRVLEIALRTSDEMRRTCIR